MKQLTESIDCLTPAIILEYWNRKSRNGSNPGRLDIVVNTDTKQYYPVPKCIEHAAFIPYLSGRPESIVPVWFRFCKKARTYYVTEIVTGASSYEAVSGVRHSQATLYSARDLAWTLLLNSKCVSNAHITRDRVIRKYCARTCKTKPIA